MKLRNAANSGWITLFQLDGEWTVVPFENGTAAAPSIYFKDSGTDTGIYSPGTDQVGISAGGTSRFEVSTSATTSTLPVVHPLGAVGTPSITFTGDLNTGIWSPAADTVAVSTNGTRAITIDGSGRLLVGTSSSYGVGSTAQAKFQASDTTSNIHASFTEWSTADSGGIIVLGKAKGGSAGNYTIVANGNVLGEIRFAGADGTDLETNGASIRAEVDGTPGSNDMPGRLVFSTTADGASSPTERMRIANTGTVSFYYGQRWEDRGTSKGISTPDFRVWNNTSNQFIIDNYTLGVKLDGGATAWSSTSDERQKTNLEPIENGLGKIAALRAVTGRYLTDAEDVSRSFLIAQDVQAVLPEAVSVESDEDATLSLRYTEVIPLLVAALKESKERIEQLEAKVAALESA